MDFRTLCAGDLMTCKIVEIERHETLRVAVGRMIGHTIHCLLIRPDRPQSGVAILTGKDCIQVIADSGQDALEELCVEDAMTKPAVTVPVHLCIEDCIQLMRMAGIRTAPVLDGVELVGLLSFTDILRAAAGRRDSRAPA